MYSPVSVSVAIVSLSFSFFLPYLFLCISSLSLFRSSLCLSLYLISVSFPFFLLSFFVYHLFLFHFLPFFLSLYLILYFIQVYLDIFQTRIKVLEKGARPGPDLLKWLAQLYFISARPTSCCQKHNFDYVSLTSLFVNTKLTTWEFTSITHAKDTLF
jgi:hypothetical protein